MPAHYRKLASRCRQCYTLISRPFAWVVAYGLLVGAGRLHAGFIHGPGEYFLPILLLGIIGGFALGNRGTGQDKFQTGTAWAVSFIGCLFVPYLLYWGWLEWRVRTVPLPPKTEWVSLHTEPTRFTGGYEWFINGRVTMPADEIKRYSRPGKRRNYRELERIRGEAVADVEDFYRERFAREGWTAGAPKDVPLTPTGTVMTRRTTFTRDGETISLSVIPNTWNLDFILQRDDPPPFGLVKLPELPWTGRPRPPRVPPMPASS